MSGGTPIVRWKWRRNVVAVPMPAAEAMASTLSSVVSSSSWARRIRCVSSHRSGVVPVMDRCGEELGVNLAVSLHAVTDELRDEIVPLNRKYPIAELLAACRRYPGASNARRITFEYVMLRGINDSEAEARELVRLLKGLPAKVNLIPFNPWPGAPYECSTPERVARFSDIVFEGGISAPVRRPRGRDIDAACGQLRTASERRSRAELDRQAEEKLAALA